MTNAERAKLAYDTFHGGLKDSGSIPHWDEAPSWVRDAVIVAYLQGLLDRPALSLQTGGGK